MKKYAALALLLCTSALSAQSIPLRLSYYAPYFITYGGAVGTSFKIDQWSGERFQFSIDPSIAYARQGSTQSHLFLRSDFLVEYQRDGKSWQPYGGLQLNFMNTWQRIGGTVSLGTGETVYEVESLQQISPALLLGYRYLASPNRDFYLQLFYGPQIDLNGPNSGLFGAELGMTYHFKKRD